MSRKTNPDKQTGKLKKVIVEQHNRLSLALQVIDKAKQHPAIGDLILQIIREVKYQDMDAVKARQEDINTIMEIFNQNENSESQDTATTD